MACLVPVDSLQQVFFCAHADNVQRNVHRNVFIQNAHGRTCSAEDPLTKWWKSWNAQPVTLCTHVTKTIRETYDEEMLSSVACNTGSVLTKFSTNFMAFTWLMKFSCLNSTDLQPQTKKTVLQLYQRNKN